MYEFIPNAFDFILYSPSYISLAQSFFLLFFLPPFLSLPLSVIFAFRILFSLKVSERVYGSKNSLWWKMQKSNIRTLRDNFFGERKRKSQWEKEWEREREWVKGERGKVNELKGKDCKHTLRTIFCEWWIQTRDISINFTLFLSLPSSLTRARSLSLFPPNSLVSMSRLCQNDTHD